METLKEVKRRSSKGKVAPTTTLLYLAACSQPTPVRPKKSGVVYQGLKYEVVKGLSATSHKIPRSQRRDLSEVVMIKCSDVSSIQELSKMLSPAIYSGEVMILPIPDLFAESDQSSSDIELFKKTLEFLSTAAEELAKKQKRVEVRAAIADATTKFRNDLLSNDAYWFTSKQASDVERLGISNPSGHLAGRRERLEVFGIQKGREWLYPRFQWSISEGRPHLCIRKVLEIEPSISRWFLIRWFETESVFLGGKRPVELVRDAKSWGKLVDAARRSLEEAPLIKEPTS